MRPYNLFGAAGVACVAYVLCDLLHEFGHASAAYLPFGVTAVSISTIGLTSLGSSAWVAAAGPLVNFALALFLAGAFYPKLSPAWRYFCWLFGTINLFNATAYFLYSAVLGSGDWAVVFNTFASPAVWRPVVGAVGVVSYAVSIYGAALSLRELVRARVLDKTSVERVCTCSFWVGGSVVTAGALLNPVSPWLILTSGAATGFGAMVGLVVVPPLLGRRLLDTASAPESLALRWPWSAAGLLAAIIFVFVFGPGLRLP
jgi:hypothetical protein